MQAVVLDEFGGPDHLAVREIEDPVAGPGEVVIEVAAAALNNLDLQVVTDGARFGSEVETGQWNVGPKLPHTLGIEAVGRIAELGEGVEGWQVGDRVMPHIIESCGDCVYCRKGKESLCLDIALLSMNTGGAFAERLAVKARRLVRVPEGISDEAAAASQVAFGTAWQALFSQADLQPAETVLVQAVGSGVGSAAVQLAKLAGAARVIGTASTDAKLERARELGLDIAINYSEQDFLAEVLRLTDGWGVDVVFEHVGGDVFVKSVEALARDGRLVTVGGHARQAVGAGYGTLEQVEDEGVVGFDVVSFFRTWKHVYGSTTYSQSVIPKVLELVDQGRLQPVVNSVFRFDEIQDAMHTLWRRDTFGKVVLKP